MSEKSNVVILPVVTTLDTTPERVLTGALDANLESVTVIGRRQGGDLYFASTTSDGGSVLWDLEIAKRALLDMETGS
jgi:hypothetical protein